MTETKGFNQLGLVLLLLLSAALACNVQANTPTPTSTPTGTPLPSSTPLPLDPSRTLAPPETAPAGVPSTADVSSSSTPLPTFTALQPTLASTITPSSTPRPRSTLRPSSTTLPRETVSTEEAGPLDFTFRITWRLNPDDAEESIASVEIYATGGGGGYDYFRDELRVEGSKFEYSWVSCKGNPGTLTVESASGQSKSLKYFERPPCPTPTPTASP